MHSHLTEPLENIASRGCYTKGGWGKETRFSLVLIFIEDLKLHFTCEFCLHEGFSASALLVFLAQ